MARTVREGVDYRLLNDDYRRTFLNTYRPKRSLTGREFYRCIYCGERVDVQDMQVDHIIPKTRMKAGILWNPNKAWNLGASCQPCNGSKSNSIDKRVFIGFRNKMLSTLGLIMADKSEHHEETSKTTLAISITIALVSFIALVILPVIGMIALGIGALFSTLKFLVRRTIKVVRKTTRRFIKLFLKKPLRNFIIIAILVYIYKVSPEVYSRFFVEILEIKNILIAAL